MGVKRVDSGWGELWALCGRSRAGTGLSGATEGPCRAAQVSGEPRIPGRVLGRSHSHSLDLCKIGASLFLHLAPSSLHGVAMPHAPDQL